MTAPFPMPAPLGSILIPRVITDPAWERQALGPSVRRARTRLFAHLDGARPMLDPRRVLAHAYAHVPFYQALFGRCALGLRDLAEPRAFASIPPTRRADLAPALAPFLTHPIDEVALQRGWLGRTSGSTGEPVAYLRDPRTIAWFCAFLDFALAYARKRAATPDSKRSVVLLDVLAHRPEYDARLPLFHDARFAKRSSAVPDDQLKAALVDLSPRIVSGDPDALAPLGRIDLPPRARPSLVLSSAFAMPVPTRRAIERATGAAVVEYYGAQEVGLVAIECREGRGLHALSGACHVESIARSDDEELLVTPLGNPSFTLIRYAPGDLGRVRDDGARCACGLRGPRIERLEGRTNVSFARLDGGTFSPAALAPLLSPLSVREHQLVEEGPGRYRLRVRGTIDAPASAAIERRLTELAGGAVALEIESCDAPMHAPGEKPRPFIRKTEITGREEEKKPGEGS
jgi:phenylacetate-CoA ligase